MIALTCDGVCTGGPSPFYHASVSLFRWGFAALYSVEEGE